MVAARALGLKSGQIIMKHILRNIAAPILVYVTSMAADCILICSMMGYMGLAAKVPTPEWGLMIHAGYGAIRHSWHACVFPSMMVLLMVLSLNFLGDGLRDVLKRGQEDR